MYKVQGLTASDIRALGDNAEVRLEANVGDVVLGLVEAENGDVTVVSQDGDILADGTAPLNVRGDHLTLDADGAIGSSVRAPTPQPGALTTSTAPRSLIHH